MDDATPAEWLVDLETVKQISDETAHKHLKKRTEPLTANAVCIPRIDWEFVARMEDVLDLYADADDHYFPVVCFDECPIPALPGQRRYDHHYRREGTVNLFIAFCPCQGWRHITVTDARNGILPCK